MKRIIPCLLVILAAAGCKKDKTIQPSPQPGITKKLIRMGSQEYPNSMVDFTYDTAGRLISSENYLSKVTLAYNGNTVDYVNFLKTENRVYSTGTFMLNNDGYATGIDITAHPTANTTTLYHYVYEYTPEGYLSRSSYTVNGTTQTTLQDFVGGNMSAQTFQTNGVTYKTWKYFYGTEEDRTGLNTGFTVYSNTLGGKRSKYLWTKAEGYNGSNVKIDEADCINELDADGYVVKRTFHYADNTTEHYLYTYDK